MTIPAILAELDDLNKFNHVGELVAFIGLAPKEMLSGSLLKANPDYVKSDMRGSEKPFICRRWYRFNAILL